MNDKLEYLSCHSVTLARVLLCRGSFQTDRLTLFCFCSAVFGQASGRASRHESVHRRRRRSRDCWRTALPFLLLLLLPLFTPFMHLCWWQIVLPPSSSLKHLLARPPHTIHHRSPSLCMSNWGRNWNGWYSWYGNRLSYDACESIIKSPPGISDTNFEIKFQPRLN